METQTSTLQNPKKKILAYAIVPAFAIALLSAGVVSAHGFGFGMSSATPEQIAEKQNTMFSQQANLLGISVDEVKNAWASGKSLQELATEKGITQAQLQEKLQAQRDQRTKDKLAALVSQGVITQSQADARLSFLQTKMQNKAGGFKGHRGMGMGW